MNETKTHRGVCHCGAVAFEAQFDLSKGVGRCNCSICHKLGMSTAQMKPPAFKLTKGEDQLTQYRMKGGGDAYRAFCKTCGVQMYGAGNIPEIGGEFVSVNVNTLEGVELAGLPEMHFDGRHDNWEAGPREKSWPLLAKA